MSEGAQNAENRGPERRGSSHLRKVAHTHLPLGVQPFVAGRRKDRAKELRVGRKQKEKAMQKKEGRGLGSGLLGRVLESRGNRLH